MLDRFLTAVVNTAYLVPLHVLRLKVREPGVTVLAAGGTKAQKRSRDWQVQQEAGWVTSRRAVLILTPEKLVCGSWVFPLSTIQQAQLMDYQSRFGRGFVLKFSTASGNHYQFGLQYDPAWKLQSVLKFDREGENEI